MLLQHLLKYEQRTGLDGLVEHRYSIDNYA